MNPLYREKLYYTALSNRLLESDPNGHWDILLIKEAINSISYIYRKTIEEIIALKKGVVFRETKNNENNWKRNNTVNPQSEARIASLEKEIAELFGLLDE